MVPTRIRNSSIRKRSRLKSRPPAALCVSLQTCLPSCGGDLGLVALGFRRELKVVADEALLEFGEGRFGGIDELEEVHVLGGDSSGIGEKFEIEHATPVFFSVEKHIHSFSEFLGLGQSQDLEEFVKGSEPPGKTTRALAR